MANIGVDNSRSMTGLWASSSVGAGLFESVLVKLNDQDNGRFRRCAS